MIPDIDPLFSIIFILFQVGNRYLKIDITKAQEEILQLPITQVIMFFAIVYYSTKNIALSIFIAAMTLLIYNILLNENSNYNVFSERWLKEKNIITRPLNSYKDLYKENMSTLHS